MRWRAWQASHARQGVFSYGPPALGAAKSLFAGTSELLRTLFRPILKRPPGRSVSTSSGGRLSPSYRRQPRKSDSPEQTLS
jgi:hypothetical protein